MDCNFTGNSVAALKNLFTAAFFSAVLFTLSAAQAQTITTVAGDGTAGYSGDGFAATAAELNQDVGVCVDATGNIYIADSHNNVVRKVDAATGNISTVAGNGNNAGGVLMDGIPATSSELNDPWGVAVDDSGNIYIADYGDFAVRKVTAYTGIITTLAGNGHWSYSGDGGPATAATFSPVIGVGLDDSDNVYIADQWNDRIRKITVTTGIINTIAGTGTYGYTPNGVQATDAELAFPSGVVVDDSGNVYIADQENNEIRVVSPKTGVISDYAGTGAGASGLGTGGYSGDGGPATAAQINYATGVGIDDSGNIYIADWYNQVIRKVTKATGIITTVAGDHALGAGYNGDNIPATTAQLNDPSGVTADPCGNIYIADYFNYRLRKVTSNASPIMVTPLTSSICGGSPDTLTASGGTSYSWSPATGLSDTTGAIVVASPTTSTTYTLTGAGGCGGATVTTLSVIVTVTAAPAVSVSPDSPSVCNGQSVVLTVTRNTGETFQWVGTADTTNYISANPSADTAYELLVTNGACVTDTFITVTVTNAPPLYIQPSSTSVCPGTSIVLTVPASGSDYTWSPALTLSPSTGDMVTATPSSQTIYTVTGIDSLGCSVTASDTISISNAPNKPTISTYNSDLISSATQGNQWLRNDTLITGATNQTYTVTIGGYYQVIASNPANGCSTESDSSFATGINQLTVASGQVTVYPNPTGGMVNVTISTSVGEVNDWNLEVTDVLGRTVYSKQSLTYYNEIELPSADGIYFISVMNKTGRSVVPVVKE